MNKTICLYKYLVYFYSYLFFFVLVFLEFEKQQQQQKQQVAIWYTNQNQWKSLLVFCVHLHGCIDLKKIFMNIRIETYKITKRITLNGIQGKHLKPFTTRRLYI